MIANRKVGHLHSFDVFAAVSLSLFCASSKTQHNENQGEKENLLSTSSRKLMYAENRYPIRERNIPIVFATGLIYKKITCRQKAVRDNPDFFNFVFLPCSHLLLREHPLSNASRLWKHNSENTARGSREKEASKINWIQICVRKGGLQAHLLFTKLQKMFILAWSVDAKLPSTTTIMNDHFSERNVAPNMKKYETSHDDTTLGSLWNQRWLQRYLKTLEPDPYSSRSTTNYLKTPATFLSNPRYTANARS